MRKLIFVLSVILFASSVHGQDMGIAQLQQAIQQHTQQDTTRVNLLNALGNSRSLQGAEIEKLATEALAIADKTGYAKGKAYALLNLSIAKLQLGNRPQAVKLVEQADSIAKQTGDRELLAYVLLATGRINMQINNKEALANYKKADSIALQINNKKLLATCELDIAGIYQNSLSDFPKSMEYVLKSINSSEEANCQPCLTRSWATLASLFNMMGYHAHALFF
jgi:tetratricopeptide (TPR) repeat protein